MRADRDKGVLQECSPWMVGVHIPGGHSPKPQPVRDFHEALVQHGETGPGIRSFMCDIPDGGLDVRHQECRGESFARDIADADADVRGVEPDEIIEVTRDLTRGTTSDGRQN